MNPFCLIRQRALARFAVLGEAPAQDSPLTTHLLRCRTCRTAWRELSGLSEELGGALQTPLASPDFTTSIMQRVAMGSPVRPIRAAPRRFAYATAILAALALTIGWLWREMAAESGHNAAPRGQIIAQSSSTRESNRSTPVIHTNRAAQGSANPVISHSPKQLRRKEARTQRFTAERVRARPRTIHRRRIRMMAQAQPAFFPPAMRAAMNAALRTSQTAVDRLSGAQRWARWGAWCEARGDYASAENAYHRAYQAVPMPSVAFSAGRAAEAAGDTTQALDFYSRLLERRPEAKKTDPEKGSLRWNDDHGSA